MHAGSCYLYGSITRWGDNGEEDTCLNMSIETCEGHNQRLSTTGLACRKCLNSNYDSGDCFDVESHKCANISEKRYHINIKSGGYSICVNASSCELDLGNGTCVDTMECDPDTYANVTHVPPLCIKEENCNSKNYTAVTIGK